MQQPELLLISPPVPDCITPETAFLGDVMRHRFTRGQSVFTASSACPYYPLYYLAGRLNVPVKLMEGPSLEQLQQVLKMEPKWVGISFYPIHIEVVFQYCQLIRKKSPESKIVLGGLGTAWERWPEFMDRYYDEICVGEGVGFLQRILGDNYPPAPHPLMPLTKIRLPGVPFSSSSWAFAVSGLGCPAGCEYCSTSFFYDQQRISTLRAKELLRLHQDYRRIDKNLDGLFVIDEDFLRGNQLNPLIDQYQKGEGDPREDCYYIFASLDSLSKTDPDNLLRAGIGGIFVGYESEHFKKYPEHSYRNASKILSELSRRGILIILAMMFGMEHHTTLEKLDQDITGYIALPSALNQVSILTPFPGTPLAQKVMLPRSSFSGYHFYNCHNNLSPIPPEKLIGKVEETYEKLYQEKGPSVLRGLKSHLSGYEYCLNHKDPLIIARSDQYKKKIKKWVFLLDWIERESSRKGFNWNTLEARQKIQKHLGTFHPGRSFISRFISIWNQSFP